MKSAEIYSPITIEQLIIGVKNKEISLKVLIQAVMDNNFFIACNEKALTDKEMILPICTKFGGEKTACVFTKKEWAEVYMTADISVVKLKALEWFKLNVDGSQTKLCKLLLMMQIRWYVKDQMKLKITYMM